MLFRSGVQVNFVPDCCRIEIDRRLLPGESVTDVLTYYQGLIDTLAARHPGFVATMEDPMLVDEALHTETDARVVQLASQILGELGLNPDPCGVPFGSDASKLSRQGLPSIVFGPGSIDRAHAAAEFVEIDQVLRAFEFYRTFLCRFE